MCSAIALQLGLQRKCSFNLSRMQFLEHYIQMSTFVATKLASKYLKPDFLLFSLLGQRLFMWFCSVRKVGFFFPVRTVAMKVIFQPQTYLLCNPLIMYLSCTKAYIWTHTNSTIYHHSYGLPYSCSPAIYEKNFDTKTMKTKTKDHPIIPTVPSLHCLSHNPSTISPSPAILQPSLPLLPSLNHLPLSCHPSTVCPSPAIPQPSLPLLPSLNHLSLSHHPSPISLSLPSSLNHLSLSHHPSTICPSPIIPHPSLSLPSSLNHLSLSHHPSTTSPSHHPTTISPFPIIPHPSLSLPSSLNHLSLSHHPSTISPSHHPTTISPSPIIPHPSLSLSRHPSIISPSPIIPHPSLPLPSSFTYLSLSQHCFLWYL